MRKDVPAQRPPSPKVEIVVEGYVADISTVNHYGEDLAAKRSGNKFVTATIYGLDKPLYCWHRSLFPVWETMLGKVVKVRARIGKEGHFCVDLIRIGENLYQPESVKKDQDPKPDASIFIRETTWEKIRERFSEGEKEQLRGCVTGEVICPRGFSIDPDKLPTDLKAKIQRLCEN